MNISLGNPYWPISDNFDKSHSMHPQINAITSEHDISAEKKMFTLMKVLHNIFNSNNLWLACVSPADSPTWSFILAFLT